MKVLLTGHRGYLGAVMAPYLRQEGHDVVGLDTDYYAGCDFLTPPEPVPTMPLDLRDVRPHQLRGFDAVVHLAALSNDPVATLNPGLTHEINLHASIELARAAKAAGVSRFLFSSSCSLYGMGGAEALTEDAELNPVTPYGESKIAVERALNGLADETFSPTALRNATAYGLSRRLRTDVVINNLVGQAVATGQLVLNSDGRSWRPLVHVLDIAQAFARVLQAPAEVVHGEAFNVGRSGENYRIRDVAQMVADLCGGCPVVIGSAATADIRNYRVDFTKIETTLPGFEPTHTVSRGIEELRRAFSENRMTRALFDAPAYVRLAVLTDLIDGGALDGRLRWTEQHESTEAKSA